MNDVLLACGIKTNHKSHTWRGKSSGMTWSCEGVDSECYASGCTIPGHKKMNPFEPSTSERESVLAEAARLITGDRNKSYGSPEDNFARIAALWSAAGYVRVTSRDVATLILQMKAQRLNGTDVALMMDLMKTARLLENRTHRDSWVDKAGYVGCGAQIAKEMIDGDS